MNFVKRNYWECYKSKKKTSLFINESLVTINGKLLILLTKNILLPLGVTDAAIQKKKNVWNMSVYTDKTKKEIKGIKNS